MMRVVPAALLLFLVVVAPASGKAADVFYRSGQPPVIEPAERGILARRAAVLDRFQAAYWSAGTPRIALFWNRTFDERVSAWRPAARIHGRDELDVAGSLQQGGEDGSSRPAPATAGLARSKRSIYHRGDAGSHRRTTPGWRVGSSRPWAVPGSGSSTGRR